MRSEGRVSNRLGLGELTAILMVLALGTGAFWPVVAADIGTGASRVHIRDLHYTSSPVVCRRIAPLGSYHRDRICRSAAQWRDQTNRTPEERQASDAYRLRIPQPLTSDDVQQQALTARERVERKTSGTTREDRSLVQYWLALGDAELALGNHEAALTAYAHSRQIIRLNEGLKSVNQVPLLERSAKVEVLLGRLVEANSLKEQAHQLIVRAYDVGDPRYIESCIELADWYLQHHHPGGARSVLAHLLLNGTGKSGDKLLRSVLLRKFAKTIRLSSYPAAGPAAFEARPGCCQLKRDSPLRPVSLQTQDRAIKKTVKTAMQIASDHAKSGKGSAEYVGAAMDLGDWQFLIGQSSAAAAIYADLEQHPEGRSSLASVLALHVPHPGNPDPLFPRGGYPQRGSVEIDAVVNERGQVVGDLDVVYTKPQDLDSLKYRQAVRRGIFRPVFSDGKFRRRSPVRVAFEFVYLDSLIP